MAISCVYRIVHLSSFLKRMKNFYTGIAIGILFGWFVHEKHDDIRFQYKFFKFAYEMLQKVGENESEKFN
jgi:hypothetical protein